jgi:hypothetical protein
MKKNYKLKLFMTFLVIGVSVGNMNAHILSELTTKTIVADSDNWVIVQEENGVTISFSEYEIGGITYLKVKIENATNQQVTFSIDIKKKEEVFVDAFTNKISAQTSIELKDFNSIVIPINKGESFKDFSVAINFK